MKRGVPTGKRLLTMKWTPPPRASMPHLELGRAPTLLLLPRQLLLLPRGCLGVARLAAQPGGAGQGKGRGETRVGCGAVADGV
jgi:hypothetical protein